jgi:hypothetical protein
VLGYAAGDHAPESPVTAPPLTSSTSKLAFHPHRIVICVGSLLALGSMSLPYVRLAGTERGALALDTLPVLILLVPIVVMTMVPDHASALPRTAGLVAAALALLALPLSVVKLLDSVVLAETLEGAVGPGPWALVVGCLTVAAGIALGLLRPGVTHRRPVAAPSANPAPPRTRRVPSRLDENPFGEPLFDSLEVVVPVSPDAVSSPQPNDQGRSGHRPSRDRHPSEPDPGSTHRSASFVVDAENAAARIADEGGDRLEA